MVAGDQQKSEVIRMKPYNRVIHTAESDKKYKGIVAAYMRYSSDNQDEHSI